MRIAFFSPLPPAKGGIADYSAALLAAMGSLAEVEAFSSKPADFDPKAFDAIVYQLGNNPEHDFVYEMALRHPGVVVLHEANLHYLIADITLKRGEAGVYWREVKLNGGERTAHPDYRIPMLHSILQSSRAAIVHSDYVERIVRAHGFTGPIARIPHGAWMDDKVADHSLFRNKLGLTNENFLFGVFGYLKPYKRIREVLRAFRRLLLDHPNSRLILVGERHPELSLDLPPEARHIDFAPMEDFNGYMTACDAILNLRYPTVGESSGTLMRAFGMGKPAVVSDLGSFRELPDDICLKVGVDTDEDEFLLEYIKLLVERPELTSAMGKRARDWAKRECSWPAVAERYADFLQNFQTGSVSAADAEAKDYVDVHRSRLETTLSITPPGTERDWILEMGADMQITPALQTRLGYGVVRGSYQGPAGKNETRTAALPDGRTFECRIDHFDPEKDFFPYPSAHFLTVLCCELLEHLNHDPMQMMDQIHRILRPGGHLVLTTPNAVVMRSAVAVLQEDHPMPFPAYTKSTQAPELRDAREYSPAEIKLLMENSGFEVVRLETGRFRGEMKPEHGWVEHVLDKYMLPNEHRGEGIYAVGRKVGPVRERYPAWLYV